MKAGKKKGKAYSNNRQFELRDYFAKRLVDSGLTKEQFNKLMGIDKK